MIINKITYDFKQTILHFKNNLNKNLFHYYIIIISYNVTCSVSEFGNYKH